ncbi:acetyl-CoA carboxylase carboxyltransferase subunit alpha [Endomicrobium proavitum]|uniref:Acetyl-coenzyme A carboxylase carboxyl transferase subunit alpha n=1 Tax=Endomicrobium proavitum TaxID=1408281 RepID=A0A0G3WHM2_9BACT|nr:acetyl-CoA carboxylase carboxyltransferase subunit alpha [Endomicrobium proavitum]AKL97405.1 acetyl-CoA carboxylase, carboxytransferase, alpha subunit [Endomicrobium proavitum]
METSFDFEQPLVELEEKIEELKTSSLNNHADFSKQIAELEAKKENLKQKIYGSLTPWQRIQIARHPKRPYSADYIKLIFEDFVELHGDRVFGDDRALLCGMALLDGKPVIVIGHQKGRTLQENMDRNFGMAHPEGYRKAMRIMKLAEKFNRPVITFIDTSGAYPGIAAEERGQAEAIARNLRDMAKLSVPVLSVVIGEGGSGGALGIGVSNKVLMLENSYYSVISPEGCAAILFRDGSKAKDAAEAMKITAKDLLNLKVIDEIIKEPLGGAHNDAEKTAVNIKASLNKYIKLYEDMSAQKIEDDRYSKFRNMGVFEEPASFVKIVKEKKPAAKAKVKAKTAAKSKPKKTAKK